MKNCKEVSAIRVKDVEIQHNSSGTMDSPPSTLFTKKSVICTVESNLYYLSRGNLKNYIGF